MPDLTEEQRKAATLLFTNAVSEANNRPAYSLEQYKALEVAYNALDKLRQRDVLAFSHTPLKVNGVNLYFDATDDVKLPSQVIRAVSQVLCNNHVGTTMSHQAIEAAELFHSVRHDQNTVLTNSRDATRFAVAAVMVAKMEPAGSAQQQHALQVAEQAINGMDDGHGYLRLFHGNIVIGNANMYFNSSDEGLSNHDLVQAISNVVDDHIGLGHPLTERELPAPPQPKQKAPHYR